MSDLPAVLILGGGCQGLSGPLLVYLVENGLAGHVRLVDKFLVIPQSNTFLKWMDPGARAILTERHDKGIEYMQANFANAAAREKAFVPLDTTGKTAYDVVFDLTFGDASTPDNESVLIESMAKQARHLGLEALKRGGVGAYVRASSPFITQARKKCPLKEEEHEIRPTTLWAKWAHEGDRALAALKDLNLVIARVANPWGPGTLAGLTRRMTIAAVYHHLGPKEKMQFLWGKDLVLEHIHSHDLASAFWTLADWMRHTAKTRAVADDLAKAPLPPCRPAEIPAPSGGVAKPTEWDSKEVPELGVQREETKYAPLFHVTDGSGETQGDIGRILEQVMGIKVDYHTALTNSLAKLHLGEVVEIAEEKHSEPWLEMLAKSNPPVSNTPLSPVLPLSILQKNRCHLDGSKLTRLTGWKPKYPKVTAEEVERVKDIFVKDGVWPTV